MTWSEKESSISVVIRADQVLFCLKSGKKTVLRAKKIKGIDILLEMLYALSKMRNTNFQGDDFYEI